MRISDDDAAVHDMRVAVRRLRSLLRTARPLLDRPWAESVRAELDWLAGRLGVVRDLDVLIEHSRLRPRISTAATPLSDQCSFARS